MTINEVLTEVNEIKPNAYDDNMKIRWISVLEGKLIDEIFATHELENKIDFNGYTVNDLETKLLVPDTYADVYKYYVFAMIDAANQEAARYASSMALFNAAYKDFASFYNRNNRPIARQISLF